MSAPVIVGNNKENRIPLFWNKNLYLHFDGLSLYFSNTNSILRVENSSSDSRDRRRSRSRSRSRSYDRNRKRSYSRSRSRSWAQYPTFEMICANQNNEVLFWYKQKRLDCGAVSSCSHSVCKVSLNLNIQGWRIMGEVNNWRGAPRGFI